MSKNKKSRSTITNRIDKNIIGNPIRVEERSLIPVVKFQLISGGLRLSGTERGPYTMGISITPLVFVVVDQKEVRVLSLQEKKISLRELEDEVPGLAEKIEEECARREI